MSANRTVLVILTSTVMSFSAMILAQAPVEDRSVSANSNRSGGAAQPAINQDASVQIFLQLQTLRQEVTELRGMIEELNYQLEQLSSRQTNDYANLDRRILELNQAGGSTASDSLTPTGGNSEAAAGTAPVAADTGAQAAELYSQAFASLRSGDREAALRQFEELATQYPNDAAAGDALYWMGETQWVGAAYEEAREAFVALTNRFPEHRRFGDALYKLGLIYHQLGDDESAHQYLQQAVELGGDVGARSEEFLSQNMTP